MQALTMNNFSYLRLKQITAPIVEVLCRLPLARLRLVESWVARPMFACGVDGGLLRTKQSQRSWPHNALRWVAQPTGTRTSPANGAGAFQKLLQLIEHTATADRWLESSDSSHARYQ